VTGSAFSHFDNSHRENFIAALLLFAMELDEPMKAAVANVVREKLGIAQSSRLLSFGREARLEVGAEGDYARVDLWFLFDADDPFYAFVEVKSHDDWDAESVRHQVEDQCRRTTVRNPRRVQGSLLLGPDRLVRRVGSSVKSISWHNFLARLPAGATRSSVVDHAIRHIEDNMERPAGLPRSLTLAEFEQATTTMACLRQFLLDCIADIDGDVRGDPLYLTPADGTPRRAGGWAWHGLSVPFVLKGQRGRLGLYKYADAPDVEREALDTLWLEAYLGEDEMPRLSVSFAPPSLSAADLQSARARFVVRWKALEAKGLGQMASGETA
jgi:hypothetical protein